MLRDGARLTTVGLVIGMVAGLGVAPLMASELYHVTGYDPAVMAITAGALLLVAVLACWIPARNATRVDPSTALRAE